MGCVEERGVVEIAIQIGFRLLFYDGNAALHLAIKRTRTPWLSQNGVHR